MEAKESRIRVYLVDDQSMIRAGFRSLLARDARFEVAGESGDPRRAIDAIGLLRPDVVLLDISMPGMNGIEAASRLHELLPETRTVIVTVHAEATYAAAAFRAGASGYVLKRAASGELINAIHAVMRGERYVAAELPAGVATGEVARERLTQRQRDVLQLVARGRSGKEIGAALRISTKTVEFHKARIMDQLGLRTTAELTRYAMAHGLVDDLPGGG
jgi:DNA-binding NarL/FixJ family response regulator